MAASPQEQLIRLGRGCSAKLEGREAEQCRELSRVLHAAEPDPCKWAPAHRKLVYGNNPPNCWAGSRQSETLQEWTAKQWGERPTVRDAATIGFD